VRVSAKGWRKLWLNPISRPIIGIFGGFLAGVAFIALNSWFVTTMGKPEFGPFHTIATLAQGPPLLATKVWIGEGIHSGLSAFFGLVFAMVTLPWARLSPRRGHLLAAGLLYGGLIYAIDFQVLSRFITQCSVPLKGTNQPFELTVHLVFGALVALFMLPCPQRGAGSELDQQEADTTRKPATAL
jgi:hypothetical protein